MLKKQMPEAERTYLHALELNPQSDVTLINLAKVYTSTGRIESARNALQQANLRFEEHEVVTVLLENRAGELAEMADKLANAGINVHAFYLTGREGDLVELAVIVDDPKKAKKLLE